MAFMLVCANEIIFENYDERVFFVSELVDPGRARGSLLSEWFSDNAPIDEDGYVFIDRHPEVSLTYFE